MYIYLTVAQNQDYKLIYTKSLQNFVILQNFFIILFIGILLFLYIKGICGKIIFTFLPFLTIFDVAKISKYYKKLAFSRRGKVSIICTESIFTAILICVEIAENNLFLSTCLILIILQIEPILVKTVLFLLNAIFSKRNKKYILQKSEEIKKINIPIIGITGSFGKTSCKKILEYFLSEKYRVYATEKNYNTPMGIALSVEKLSGEEDFFIAEFGARRKGDIRELTKLFPPKYGIITGVCGQHQEFFGSFHTIYEEKFSLARAIPKDGFCVFGDNFFAQKMFFEYSGRKIPLLTYKNVMHRIGETVFTICYDGYEYEVTTYCIGLQAVQNIVACATFCIAVGMSLLEVCERIKTLPQTPHRLEYKSENGVHILDDGYNGNEVGVLQALDLLSVYPKPRIVVAQGLVEMGTEQRKANERIGRELSKVADVVLLTGINKKALKKGLEQAGFDKNILVCRNMKKAIQILKNCTCEDCTVYLQNDIPSYY